MKVLLVGGGGREHAIAWKLVQSPLCEKLYCAPGNAGIAQIAELVDIGAEDSDGLTEWAARNGMGLVVVAPDGPLALGLTDRCRAAGLRVFGPSKAAAEIEWSKVFSKGLMKKYGIPTAAYETFDDRAAAVAYATAQNPSPENPLVIKADGLALGKGAVIVRSPAEAEETLRGMMDEGRFSGAGKRAVIEEYMRGRELTVLCFTDGKTIRPMPPARDHKRAYDNDGGPNTGGMGVVVPPPDYTPELAERCVREIFRPTVNAMSAEGRPFSGVLYFELMLTKDGPEVIEYNARFGDPEAQALLPLLESDLLEIFIAVEEGRLREVEPVWSGEACACVVAASGGYPDAYRAGLPVTGLDRLPEGVIPFHAGTGFDGEGNVVTKGGRVLSLCAKGKTLADALRRVYRAMDGIKFDGIFYRKDIGKSSGAEL